MRFKFVIVGSLLFFAHAPSIVSGNDPDIRGKITEIHRPTDQKKSQVLGTIMVEAEEDDAKVDKVNVMITAETRILKEEGKERVQATIDDLAQ